MGNMLTQNIFCIVSILLACGPSYAADAPVEGGSPNVMSATKDNEAVPEVFRNPVYLGPPAPIRMRRRLMVLAEAGFNGLSGLGVNVGYQLGGRVGIDAGLGVGIQELPKVGLRGRYHFTTKPSTALLAAALSFVPGAGRDSVHTNRDGQVITSRTYPVLMASGMFGYSLVAETGFTLLTGVGLAVRLTQNEPYKQTPPPGAGISSILTELAFGSGPLATVAMGYSF